MFPDDYSATTFLGFINYIGEGFMDHFLPILPGDYPLDEEEE